MQLHRRNWQCEIKQKPIWTWFTCLKGWWWYLVFMHVQKRKRGHKKPSPIAPNREWLSLCTPLITGLILPSTPWSKKGKEEVGLCTSSLPCCTSHVCWPDTGKNTHCTILTDGAALCPWEVQQILCLCSIPSAGQCIAASAGSLMSS